MWEHIKEDGIFFYVILGSKRMSENRAGQKPVRQGAS